MLNSLEIYQALNGLGYRLEAGKFEPSSASEHPLGNGKYLYVKRSRDGVVNKSRLVLAPETLALKAEIERIAGIHWSPVLHAPVFRSFARNLKIQTATIGYFVGLLFWFCGFDLAGTELHLGAHFLSK